MRVGGGARVRPKARWCARRGALRLTSRDAAGTAEPGNRRRLGCGVESWFNNGAHVRQRRVRGKVVNGAADGVLIFFKELATQVGFHPLDDTVQWR